MKILINSYPRSGTTTFVDATRLTCIDEMIHFKEDFFHKEKWVAKSHIPVLFLGSFPEDITIGTVIRDPIDAISSNCFRWANGHTGNIVHGKIVVDQNRAAKENKFDGILKDLIRHQTEQYISYYTCLKNGSADVKIFSYEDIQNKIVDCVNRIVSFAGGNMNNLHYDAAINVVKNPPQPTKEKTDLYYQIRDYIRSLDLSKECYNLYNNIYLIKEMFDE